MIKKKVKKKDCSVKKSERTLTRSQTTIKPTMKPIKMSPYLIIFLLCMSVLPPSMDALSKTGLSTAKFALIVEAASSSVVDIVEVEAVVVVSISKFPGCL
jgi:hypothetical protein